LCVHCACRWALQKGKTALKVVPDKVALVTGVPCTLLRMDASGEYLAVGASDGAVTVFATKQLSRVSQIDHSSPAGV
jgi:hypothetical protein